MEMARCLLKECDLPNSLQLEAICTTKYIQNRSPTSSCDCTCYENLTDHKRGVSNIKTFGCRAYADVQKFHRGKLDNTAKVWILVGCDKGNKGYRICLDGRKSIINRTLKFLEVKHRKII